MQLAIENFLLQIESVICPACNVVFATPNITRMPNMTRESKVEADLHRVLPDPIIRASFVAICPSCMYSWWFSAFASHYIIPDLVPDTPDVELSRKFAHAVLTGRNNGSSPLERFNLAMNGCWCSREQFMVAGTMNSPEYQEENTRWLQLAAQELGEALADESWSGNRNRYIYQMGEILRQLGQFEQALEYFNQVDRRSMLPKQLVDHQKQMAAARQSHSVTLPPHLVEEIFLPKRSEQPIYIQYAIPPQAQQQQAPSIPQQQNTTVTPATDIYAPQNGNRYSPNSRLNGLVPQQHRPGQQPAPPKQEQYEGYLNIPLILPA
ncbi:MAG TPA: DUF2225 domain-containing protein [Drouetiella sp.]